MLARSVREALERLERDEADERADEDDVDDQGGAIRDDLERAPPAPGGAGGTRTRPTAKATTSQVPEPRTTKNSGLSASTAKSGCATAKPRGRTCTPRTASRGTALRRTETLRAGRRRPHPPQSRMCNTRSRRGAG